MDCNFREINNEDVHKVFSSYYEYFTRIYGKSIFSAISNIAISRGALDSSALSTVDDAYKKAMSVISDNNNGGPKIIVIESEDGEYLGFFRNRFLIVNGVNFICISELVLQNEMDDNRTDMLKEAIRSIELETAKRYPEAENLDFEVGRFDTQMQVALVESGFAAVGDQNAQYSFTHNYEKQLRKRESSR